MFMLVLVMAVALCLELTNGSSGYGSTLLDTLRLPPSFEVWVNDLASELGDNGGNSEEADNSGNSEEADNSGNSEQPNFPLQRTEVNAHVTGGVAHVRVTQVYRNDGTTCLQSRYIFPLPTKAAISAMSMRIGNRTVIGEIRTRDQAREEFNAARDAGKSASLLNQERPNVFAMELANILPGETTEVVVEYSETLSPVDGVYEFVFPAVVGPRYGQDWTPGSDTSDLSNHVNLIVTPSCLGMSSSLAFQELSNTASSTEGRVVGMNADVIIRFWFTEGAVGAQFLLAQRGLEKYFSLAIQPPQRQLLQPEQISQREYLFILDVSGSMTGYPIDLSKSLMTKLLKENVRTGDSLNIMLFAGSTAILNENGNVEATPENIDSALNWLDENMRAGGGTRLLNALQRAYALPRFSNWVARTIVIMTDGYVSVEKEAFDLVRNNLGEGNVFVFGIGTSVNRYLVEGLARVGYGEPFVVTNQSVGDAMVQQLQRFIDTPVLTQLELSFSGSFRSIDQEPPYLPDVFASRPIHVIGKWEGELSGNLKLQGRLADGTLWEYSAELANIEMVQLPVVPLLWARSRIAVLGDYGVVGQKAEAAITALGLNYSLMTQYTSFVSVDSDPSGPAICRAANNSEKNSLDGNKHSKEYASGGFVSAASVAANVAPLYFLIAFVYGSTMLASARL